MGNPTTLPSLSELELRDDFVSRHIGPSASDIAFMLQALGQPTLDALIEKTVPQSIRNTAPLAMDGPIPEHEALAEIRRLAERNVMKRSLIGCGYHATITPGVIQRNVLENPGWYTAYTPYQPEISQGRLEGLLSFQQMIIDLTGLPLANASLLDEATAAAEAMTLCKRSVKRNTSERFFVAADCHPQIVDVVRTRAEPMGLEVVVGELSEIASLDIFGALLAYPGTDGRVQDLHDVIDQIHAKNALAVVAADIMSLLLLTSPGEMGADIAIGNTQRFGVPMGFGGPHAAYFATREEYKRSVPGRIIGVSIDTRGNQALRMAMQTREQHIRREKATSNICTAQALLALMAAFYAVYHGPERLRSIAQRIHRLTQTLAAGLAAGGIAVKHAHYFDTLCCVTGSNTDALIAAALECGFNLRRIDDAHIGISLDECSTADEVTALWRALIGDQAPVFDEVSAGIDTAAVPASSLRQSAVLVHPVFNQHHSETAMLRYLHSLEGKDIALNRAMIPLGSCTMKLNATAEMMPISWPEFANLHPFAPPDQSAGYQQLIEGLADALLECTGYDAMSFQPNSGAQGEYAGLLAIRAYHHSRGDPHRDICLIPSSAHGTNPASAVMAGMKVVIVRCDDFGNVDIDDLRDKASAHGPQLAALMVTYPSTHGVFEPGISEICNIIHQHGGQVYLDGANLNAMVGLAKPGKFGADVSHLNLHKTFCIPHGGGGPGMGPIGVGAHLAPFLPGHVVTRSRQQGTPNGAVSAAPFGSPGILPISWMYCRMMGGSGLTEATRVAILSANYIAHRLGRAYSVLYTGVGGCVAHECIIDIRPIKERSGISEEDIAKRLIDYGFHAPTMSFPVAGTLMIEPTESESLNELDRFCDAMLSIHSEICAVESGQFEPGNNMLTNAPHTVHDISVDQWPYSYSRTQAAFPVASLRANKYWPPVSRLDNVYGDRHLFCSCPIPEAYQ